ncbi:transposase [Streptomyces pharetrae]|uniref:transposase n=1 Tax=Streptomyces pharetrae TaxID=291370 RepID=UPI003652B1E0
MSLPGVGVRTGARILIEVGDGSTFPTTGHLAAYAGLAPAPRSSAHRSAANNRPGEETSSSNGPSCSPSRSCPGRPGIEGLPRQEDHQGKHHTQALLCLARCRTDVLFAMLRDGTFYEPQPVRSG